MYVHLPGYYAVFDANRQGQAEPEINVQMHHLKVNKSENFLGFDFEICTFL
jgi:hypothetical protein